MAAVVDQSQLRPGDAGGDLMEHLRRRDRVLLAAQHQRRAFDPREVGAAVRPGHDRPLLCDEALAPYAARHLNHGVGDRTVADMVRMEELGQQPRCYA